MAQNKDMLCIYKSLVFDATVNKFDAKNFQITGVADCVEDSDVVNLKCLKEELSRIKDDILKLKLEKSKHDTDFTETRSRIKTNKENLEKKGDELARKISELDKKINDINRNISNSDITKRINEIGQQFTVLLNTVERYEEMTKEISIVKGDLKEVVYEIVSNRNSNSSFNMPKKFLDNMLSRTSFNPNLYSRIVLKNTSVKISLQDAQSKFLTQQKKVLKKPLEMNIGPKVKSIKNSQKNNYYAKFLTLRTYKHVPDQETVLPKNFTSLISILPEKLEFCFAQPSEAAANPTVVELKSNIKVIILKIIFVVEVFYRYNDTNSNTDSDDDSDC